MIKLPVIIGPTASGKTNCAVHLAKAMNGAIISADSRQVYKKMDIGTGKDLDEYTINKNPIPYYLIDICEPGEKYNINRFYHDFAKAIKTISQLNQSPILCGGSGLYVQTALEQNELSAIPTNNEFREHLSKLKNSDLKELFSKIRPILKKKLDSSSKKRLIRALEINNYLQSNPYPEMPKIEISPILFGIDIPREERRKKISLRLKERLKNGMIEEVEKLQETVTNEDLKYYGLEYLFVTEYLEGKYNFNELYNKLEIAIHQFSKRQMTWFRKMEREGYAIHWIAHNLSSKKKIEKILPHLEIR